jgi:hypothetical protein
MGASEDWLKKDSGCNVRGGLSAAGFILLVLFAVGAGDPAIQAQSAPVYTPPVVAPNDTLSGVKYDARWEFYGGPAYAHFDAGPNLLQGANLGGLDVQAARWSTKRWAAVGNLRAYLGTSGAVPNPYNIHGPFVAEFFALAGPEYRGPSNEHASMTFHALVGPVYGLFDKALKAVPPATVGFYNNQWALGAAVGGSIDLNRSQKLAFRISPDATLTNFGSNGIKEQFALSVGIVYRLGHIVGK